MSSANYKRANKKYNLQQLIEKSGTNPEFRSLFYREFLEQKLFVLTEKGKREIPSADRPIIVLSNQFIPVFSERDRIYDGDVFKDQADFFEINGRELLTRSQGRPVVVNPFSEIYKELVPLEISEMLSGSIFENSSNQAQLDVLIGHPKVYPSALVDDLKKLFRSLTAVEAAHIGWIFNPAIDREPHYIFALVAQGNFKQLADAASKVTQKHLKSTDVVDFIQLEKGGNLSDFFYKQTQAFYVKQT